MYKIRRRILSQNFIYNRTLIKKLVRESSIGLHDTVLEIGSGKGFITSELLSVAKRVIAVEIDPKLVLHVEKFLGNDPKLDVYLLDFLDFHLPEFSYKVFANIPFSIEGKIIRKLLDDKNPPVDCYLVVRKDLAERLSGENGNNQFVMKYKPWYIFDIYYHFNRNDFIPKSSMDCVMWRVTKRANPLIPLEEKQTYQRFIKLAFGDGLPIERNLKRIVSKSEFQKLAREVKFSLNVTPTHLLFEQWLTLYSVYSRCLIDQKEVE